MLTYLLLCEMNLRSDCPSVLWDEWSGVKSTSKFVLWMVRSIIDAHRDEIDLNRYTYTYSHILRPYYKTTWLLPYWWLLCVIFKITSEMFERTLYVLKYTLIENVSLPPLFLYSLGIHWCPEHMMAVRATMMQLRNALFMNLVSLRQVSWKLLDNTVFHLSLGFHSIF